MSMKAKAIQILNRICKDEYLRELPVMYLCRTVALTLIEAERIEKEEEHDDKSIYEQ